MVEARLTGTEKSRKPQWGLYFLRGGSEHLIESGQRVRVLRPIDVVYDGHAIVQIGSKVRHFQINANGTAQYRDLAPKDAKYVIENWNDV